MIKINYRITKTNLGYVVFADGVQLRDDNGSQYFETSAKAEKRVERFDNFLNRLSPAHSRCEIDRM